MTRTFLDAGVLIAATRGAPEEQDQALSVLRDTDRKFLTSIFLYLEVAPKAIFHRKQLEHRFYRRYFRGAQWCNDTRGIANLARRECAHHGLGAMDGLHTAAACLLEADELITTEKPAKSIYRSTLVRVVYLFQ